LKAQHLKKYLKNAKERAMRKGLEFDLTYEYLESIATTHCPIFGIEFEWGTSNMGKGKTKPNCPSLDRIVPELGYVQGNVAFISHKANRIKDNGTMQDHYDIADWIWEQTYAKQGQPAPIPKKHFRKGADDTKPRTIHGAGVGEDCDGAHHHRGEPKGCNVSDSTQEGCRICMGSGVRQVEALELYENCETYGLSEREIERLAKCFGCICYQS
jgi:hypothetical protein